LGIIRRDLGIKFRRGNGGVDIKHDSYMKDFYKNSPRIFNGEENCV
jgi:hypothetical protein